MSMKRIVITFLVLLFYIHASAQFGVRAKYDRNTFKDLNSDIEDFFEVENVYQSGYELGVDYWFRLKTRRIEFMPEVYFAQSSTKLDQDIFNSINLTRIGFNFNTHFYLLDFEEDCDCPTFSKEGPGIQKGFFFHISPGLSYDAYGMKTDVGDVNENNLLAVKLGGGVGIDIGINDLLTISPIYTYNYFMGNDWELNTFPGFIDALITTNTNSVQHQFAIRIGLRLDQ